MYAFKNEVMDGLLLALRDAGLRAFIKEGDLFLNEHTFDVNELSDFEEDLDELLWEDQFDDFFNMYPFEGLPEQQAFERARSHYLGLTNIRDHKEPKPED